MRNEEWKLTRPSVQIAQVQPERIQILRVRGDVEAVRAELSEALGLVLDPAPNQATGSERRAVWLAPGDWMLVGDVKLNGSGPNSGLWHLSDVTDGRVVFEIAGPDARNLLGKGTSLDLHPRSFGIDQSAQTLFAQLRVLLDQISEQPKFNLYADISFSSYLKSWFGDAIEEFN